ncbi:hypothetical protein [Anaerocolumna xylanovorans]|uniref:2TM domain-containing protein n=1 Tax=Anaerocolumna xylanovorans DSM 12503 TaxID=1121345 RepID=A0A1M7YBT5_9FIRM|nr:hypothetical protein [Anaerocolumna xylanovorans]SHO50051.1 hypothetical protein SAMN02745217_02551 [Anaerocolumna xylanovorans DSM 12503]
MKQRSRRKRKPEFSKQIMNEAKTECWVITAIGVFFAWKGLDVTLFSYLIPVSWGGYAIARAFYYNKAKAENAIKLRKAYEKAGLDSEPAKEQFESSMNEEIQSNY